MSTPVLLISHGFQASYEKAFSNAVAEHGVAVTLAASARTEYARLDSRIVAPNLLPSMDPSRSIGQKVRAKLAYVLQLAALVVRNRRANIHLIGTFLTTSVFLGIFELVFYRLFGKRLLLTVHNLLPHDKHTGFNSRAAWFAYRIPHVLVVHTDRMRDELVRVWGVRAERVLVMEHGVDDIPPDGQPPPETAGRTRLLMFGSVARYKGVDTALRALAAIQDFPIELTITGICRDQAYADEIAALINAVPPLHRVVWNRGYVPEEEVQGCFEAAEAVLLPYRHIDQSGVLFTAFRFGLPVVAFNVGAFDHYVTPDSGIVCPSNDELGLVDGLRALRKNVGRFERRAIKKYAERYLWTNTIEPVLDEYAKAV